MNKYRYLDILSSKIASELPKEEFNNVMQYYTEYFADAGIEKESEVIDELGSPEALAEKIIAEYKGKNPAEVKVDTKKKGLSIGWIITIAIVGSPIWLGLFCAAIGIVAAVFAVVVSIAAIAIAGVLAGITLVVGGIVYMFTSAATGVLVIGAGFATGAIGLGFTILSIFLIALTIKGFKALSENRKKRRESK